MRRLETRVDENGDGDTVERVLRDRFGLTHHAVSHAKFQPDGLCVNGKRIHATEIVHAGDIVSIVIGDSEQALEGVSVQAVAGPLEVVFEDEDLLVIDKRAGVAMYPGPGHYGDTLANHVLAHFEENGTEARFHPVHRLDRGTSGLVVVAKNAHVQCGLQRHLHDEGFIRRYLAVCEGTPEPREGRVAAPLLNVSVPTHVEVSDRGKPAFTRYRVLEVSGACSLVSLTLETGRTHQIRAHMAYLGHPLVGDAVYGHASERIERPALHSAHLEITHPISGEPLVFDSPLPSDMQALLGV